jgi:hypothetical protein
MIISIRRQWNNWQIAEIPFEKIGELHWSDVSGGVNATAPQKFVHGYVYCHEIVGDIAHSCAHGEGPHRIKVVVLKRDNEDQWSEVLKLAGPKPPRKRAVHRLNFGGMPKNLTPTWKKKS